MLLQIGRPIGKEFHKGSYRKAGSRGKPQVRTGASPYQPTVASAYDVMLLQIGRPIDKDSQGVTPQGRMTRKAPVRTEPHPTNPRCLGYAKRNPPEQSQGRITRKARFGQSHPTCARSQLTISSLAPRAAFQLPANRRAHNRRCGLGPHTVRRPVQRFVHG